MTNSNYKQMGRQYGMALFQVLVMVGIFSTLLLLMVSFSQQSVEQTQQLQNAAEHRLQLYSAQRQLQFQLLTQPWGDNKSPQWNFYGAPFKYQLPDGQFADTSYKIQDLNSLLNWQFPGAQLVKLLENSEVNHNEAQRMVKQLADAQTLADKLATGQQVNSAFPHLPFFHQDEIARLPLWSESLVRQLAPSMNLYSQSFHPYNSPDHLLPALLSAGQVDIIRQWRQQGVYSTAKFSQLTGIQQDDIVSFYPGPAFRIEVRQDHSDLVLVEELKLEPYRKVPLVRFSHYYTQSY
jgi:type II secretory pathway pseudopilin PulG